MEVILLEKSKLGNIGEVVTVKNGYGCNYLLPQKKAIRANAANKQIFEEQRAVIEEQNRAKLQEARDDVARMGAVSIILIRQAGEDGRLFGSVTTKDIADAVAEKSKIAIVKAAVILENAIKYIGEYKIALQLHPEVSACVTLTVVRSEAEAAELIKKSA